MARDFRGQLTLPAATATNLLALLAAAGFTSTGLAVQLTIKEAASDIYRGTDNTVTNANGELIASGASDNEQGLVDLAKIWLYSVPGTTFSCKVQGHRGGC